MSKKKTTPVTKKPEFWVTFVTSVAGLLLSFGVITPDQAKDISAYVPNLIGALITLFSTAKFIAAQTASKIEVFRAMCAMRSENREREGKITAQGVISAEEDVARLAQAAGL